MIPDTGADSTVIGLQHLKNLGFSKSDLAPLQPWLTTTLTALGSFQAKLTYSARSCTGWVDVQSYLGSPLLSWKHCRDLGIVPENFLQQIRNGNRVRRSANVRPKGKHAKL